MPRQRKLGRGSATEFERAQREIDRAKEEAALAASRMEEAARLQRAKKRRQSLIEDAKRRGWRRPYRWRYFAPDAANRKDQWRFCWSTVKDADRPDKPWSSWIEKPRENLQSQRWEHMVDPESITRHKLRSDAKDTASRARWKHRKKLEGREKRSLIRQARRREEQT